MPQTGVVNECLRLSFGPISRLPRVATHEALYYKDHVIPPGVSPSFPFPHPMQRPLANTGIRHQSASQPTSSTPMNQSTPTPTHSTPSAGSEQLKRISPSISSLSTSPRGAGSVLVLGKYLILPLPPLFSFPPNQEEKTAPKAQNRSYQQQYKMTYTPPL